jgi:hypothetical protein
VAAGGDIVFSLRLDENMDEVVSTSVENTHPNLPRWYYREVVLVVPGDVTYGEYHILASHSDSGAEGKSDVFSIQGIGEGGPGHPTAWEIRVVFPSYLGVNWPRGSIKLITWRIDGEYPSERAFLVTLMRGAESVKTISAGGAVWNGTFETYSLKWVMPTDIPLASDYRIEVVDRNGLTEGISEREFSVTRPICGIEVGLVDLEVHSLDPSSGFLYRVGQPLNFVISSSGLVEVTAQLVPVEEDLRHWSIPLRDTGGGFTTASFSWTPPPEIPVGDYRIYVTAVIPGCATGTGHAYSEVFRLYAPIPDPEYEINVTSPREGQIVSLRSYSLFLIMWYGCGFPDVTSFTRILYKGSVELQRIGPDERPPPPGRECCYDTNFNVTGYASGSDYHVRVEAWSPDGTELLASDNTENFTLLNMSYECSAYQPLVIFSPNNYASEVRVIGRPLSIAWCHYPDASPDQRIRLLLVRDTAFGGGEWEINSSIPSSPSQTTWVIPTLVPPGDGYRVRAEQIGGTGVATSVRTFSISNP